SDAGNYTLRLDAASNLCKSSATNTFSVIGDETTAVVSIEKDEFVRAFPNPANETLTIVWNTQNESFKTVRISDITGKTVQQIQLSDKKESKQLKLNLKELAEGTYMITVEGNDISKTV